MNLNASWSAKSSTMSNCLLCHTRLNTRNLIYLDQLLVQDTTLCDAINQQIQFNILPLDKPTTSQVSCRNCFNAFKSFYKFLHKVKSNLRPVKAENFVELPAYEPVRVCTVKIEKCPVPDVKFEPVLMLDGYQALNNELDSGQDTPSSISNQNPRMDSSRVESDTLRSNLDILSTNLDNSNPGADPASFRDDSDFEWSCDDPIDSVDERPQFIEIPERKTRESPAPRSSQSFDSGQESIQVDRQNIKTPRRSQQPPDPSPSRKHPAHDPEGEKIIKKFIDTKCYVCQAHIESFLKLKQHFRRVHPGQKAYFICCNRKFRRRFELLDHIEVHDTAKVFTCSHCQKEYKNRSGLRTHIKNYHQSTDKSICEECGKICLSPSLLKSHMQIHFVDTTKTFECYKCNSDSRQSTFKNLFHVKSHMRSKHSLDGKENVVTVCYVCSATVRAAYFKQHMKRVHPQKRRERVKCEMCDSWVLETTLVAHLQRHNDMGVNCKLCGKFLKSKNSLSSHMKIAHSQNYKFKCEYCDKGFHKVMKMQEHVAARHTREFLFKCRVPGCERQFRAEGCWKIHEKKMHPVEYDKFFKPSYKRGPEELRAFEERTKTTGS